MCINKCFAVAILSFVLTVGMVIGCTLQAQSDIEQIETIIIKSANSDSHLLSVNEKEIYFIISFNPFDFSNLNISEHLNLSKCITKKEEYDRDYTLLNLSNISKDERR